MNLEVTPAPQLPSEVTMNGSTTDLDQIDVTTSKQNFWQVLQHHPEWWVGIVLVVYFGWNLFTRKKSKKRKKGFFKTIF